MINKIRLLIMIIFTMLLLIGCFESEVTIPKEFIKQEVIGKQFIEQRQEVITEYNYKWNWWTGEFQLVPEIKTETYPEKYIITLKIYYNDETTKTKDKEVNKSIYEKYDIGMLWEE